MRKQISLYPVQREGYVSQLIWLDEHDIDIQRFLDMYWMPEDHDYIRDWFFENPYYGKIVIQDFLKSNDEKIKEVITKFSAGKSLIVFVLGRRGSGKSATIFWLAELVRHERKVFCIMLNGKRKKDYPKWVIQIDEIDQAEYGGFVFYDEGVLQANARETGGKMSVYLTKELAIARHKDLTVVFGFQHTKLGDVNIFRMADCSFVKPNNAFMKSDERSFTHHELVKFMQPSISDLTLFVMDKTYIKFIQPLPQCWSDSISKAHRHLDLKEFVDDGEKAFKNRSEGSQKQSFANRKASGNSQGDQSLAHLT